MEDLGRIKILEMVKNDKISIEEGCKLLSEQLLQRQDDKGIWYHKVWEEYGLIDNDIDKESIGNILLFDIDEEISDILRKMLRNTRNNIILVKPGESFTKMDGFVYEINPQNRDDYITLLDSIQEENKFPKKVIHIWNKKNLPSDDIEKQMLYGVYSLYYITQIFMMHRLKNKIEILYVFSSNEDNREPFNAALSGFIKTIHLEISRIKYKTINLRNYRSDKNDEISALLLNEFNYGYEYGIEIRYENNKRMIKKLKELYPDKELKNTIPLKENSVYLITGGAGGLGFLCARYLAEKIKAKLILSGRSDLDINKEEKFQEIRSLGSEIFYLKGDISKQDDVNKLIGKIKKEFKQLNGIIHCAGVNCDSYILKKTEQDMESVFAPKIYGTIYLDEATRDEELDFFILFSSIAAELGNVGQSDYAYSNSFMDNFAEMREKLCKKGLRRGKNLSINWPFWQDGGMQIPEDELASLYNRTGLKPLPAEQGIRFFEMMLELNAVQILLLYGDINRINNFGQNESADNIKGANNELFNTELLFEKTERFFKEVISNEIKLPYDKIDSKGTFEEYGIDSIIIKNFNVKMERSFGYLPKTLLYEFQTIYDLTAYMVENYKAELSRFFKFNNHDLVTKSNQQQSTEAIRKTRQRDKTVTNRFKNNFNNEDVAIIGVSGRYPFAENIDEYWENLKNGRDCISEIPEMRWSLDEYYDPDPLTAKFGKIYCKWGGFLEDVKIFDPLFFNISPREAEIIDPQERLFLQCAWEVLEDAGYIRKELIDKSNKKRMAPVGVFVGVTTNTYQLWGPEETARGNFIMPNSSSWSIANRVSYLFNFNGPSMPVDTACSSSLIAVHLACESIKKGECDYAIAGGVNLYLHPSKYIGLCLVNMLSQKGRCSSFGDEADGFVPGEGIGAIFLKPLSRAINEKDHIYGVIKGTSMNHGGRTSGYTVPNPNAQREVILDALAKSNINPRTISYIEAHGTGTIMGDPVEITGLMNAYKRYTSDTQYCALGSVKSNIGHLESAAGISGITKILLQMKYKQLVPSLHAEKLNPNINFTTTPFYVQHNLSDWIQPEIAENDVKRIYPRRSGINSFGAGGANAHIIIEEYQESLLQDNNQSEINRLIPLSAKSEEKLKEYARKIIDFIEREEIKDFKFNLDDLAYTLQVGREPMEERLIFIASSIDVVKERLNEYCEDKINAENFYKGNIKTDTLKSDLLINGKEGEEYIRIIIDERRLSKIAHLWISGIDIEWELLHKNDNAKRISLPTYPFSKERYWISMRGTNSSENRYLPSAKLHPLIDSNESTFSEQYYKKVFKEEEFYIKNYIIEENKIVPGLIYIEMVIAAGNLAAADINVIKLKNLIWSPTIAVHDIPEGVKINLYPDQQCADIEITAAEEGKEELIIFQSEACFGSYADMDRAEYIDIDSVIQKCPHQKSGNECYDVLIDKGLNYNPLYKVIKKLHYNTNEALVLFILPEMLINSSNEFIFHPCLMDGILQSINCLMILNKTDLDFNTIYEPYKLEELAISNNIINRCYVHILVEEIQRNNGSYIMRFHVRFLDNDGCILMNMKDFYIRPYMKNLHIVSESTNESENTYANTKDISIKLEADEIMTLLKKLEIGELDIEEANSLMEEIDG